MREFEVTAGDFTSTAPEMAQKAHRELATECSFEYDFARSTLQWMELSFYPQGTWLCRLELDPQTVKMRRRTRALKTRTTYFFVFRPSDEGMPIMPLGNDTDWVLRANKYYGLTLGARRTREDELNLAEMVEVDNPIILHKITCISTTTSRATTGTSVAPCAFACPARLRT
jgi:hypothetical protein